MSDEARETVAPPRPFSLFEWIMAGRYLRARGRESAISIIAGFSLTGIALGVATLIIVMAVMNGFRSELLSKILGINGHLIVTGLGSPLTDYETVSDRLRRVEGVTAVIPLVEGQALASGPTGAGLGVLVRGAHPDDLVKIDALADAVITGRLADTAEEGGIAIGRRLAANLGITQGDSLTLIAPRGAITPMGVAPRVKAYPVVAVFEIGMVEYDSTFVFMPFDEAQAYFNSPDAASAIEVYIEDPDDVSALRPAIEQAVDRQMFLTDWRQRNVTFFSALEVERNMMFIILTLIVLVAALNIISGLTMLVMDKGRDIAILRTVGATRGSILRIFFINGASIGVVGTLIGLVLGTLVCLNVESIRLAISRLTSQEVFSPEIYFLSRLPADIDLAETAAIVLMALSLSFLATLLPAWKAARLDPVEALRYE